MKKIYRLNLINENPELDLSACRGKIQAVINEILSGGKTGSAFNDVTSIRVLDIGTHELILDVEETGVYWHSDFGKKLANDYGMREYCDPSDPGRMFKGWE